MTSDTSILALLGTTLVASLAGSLHCAGMCGGIALVAGGRGSGREIAIASGGYHGGRFVAYAALGAAAGLAGGVLDLGGNLIGIQRVASIVAGLTIAGLGLLHLARLAGLRLPAIGAFPPLVTAMRAMHGFAARLRPFPRGLTLGLGTPLLPCGWLWAFIAIAAGTGTALGGAAVLSAFWFGTVPALVAVTGGAGAMAALRSPRLAAAVPTVAALAMVAIGLIIGSHGRATAMSDHTRERLDLFWQLLDEILNGMLFVLIGLEFAVISYPAGGWLAAALTVGLSLLARFVVVGLPVLAWPAWFRLPAGSAWLLTWSGVRGGISVALSLSLPPGPERDVVLMLTYSVVVFSILVQGLTVGRLVRRLPAAAPDHG